MRQGPGVSNSGPTSCIPLKIVQSSILVDDNIIWQYAEPGSSPFPPGIHTRITSSHRCEEHPSIKFRKHLSVTWLDWRSPRKYLISLVKERQGRLSQSCKYSQVQKPQMWNIWHPKHKSAWHVALGKGEATLECAVRWDLKPDRIHICVDNGVQRIVVKPYFSRSTAHAMITAASNPEMRWLWAKASNCTGGW